MANMTEDQIQQAVIRWSQQASVRKMFPQLALLYHIPNERKCTPQQGARLKRMGVKSGVPDLHLPVARGVYHGLYLEMKTGVRQSGVVAGTAPGERLLLCGLPQLGRCRIHAGDLSDRGQSR